MGAVAVSLHLDVRSVQYVPADDCIIITKAMTCSVHIYKFVSWKHVGSEVGKS